MSEKFIPYGKQFIDEDDINEVIKTLKSDFLTTGPRIKEFENRVCEYLNVKYAVALSNGTAALHAACFAAGIEHGDEVITSPITFAASANAVLYCSGTPVFADIDKSTYNISSESIKEKISPKTKAIMPVHFTGQPCDMDAIMGIAKENDLVVIEDGAHVLGATYKGNRVGCIGDMMTISFHPVKHITTGEGGIVVTNSKELYDKLILFRTHGITKNFKELQHDNEPWYYEQHILGYNYRITDIQCALGISQMKKIDFFIKRRREIAKAYNDAFKELEGVIIPYQIEESQSAWHIYVIQLELAKLSANRTAIFNELRKKNLGVNVHYIPVYYHPYYKELGYEKGLCPNAEDLYESIITIPLYPLMSNEDVQRVIDVVKEVIDTYRI